MALIGLVRVGTDPEDARLQRQALKPICSRLGEETASRRRLIKNRPGLLAAVEEVGDGDALTVTHARSLSMVHGLGTLLDLVDRRVAVKVLKGLAAGEHTGDSEFLDDVRELTRLRRELQSARIAAGIRATRQQGTSHGRPRMIGDDNEFKITTRRAQGESIRAIAQAIGVSVGSVHRILSVPTRGLRRIDSVDGVLDELRRSPGR